MGKQKTPHVHDFGIFCRVHDSENQLLLSLETPGYLNQSKKKQIILKHIILGNLEISQMQSFENVERQAPKNQEDLA